MARTVKDQRLDNRSQRMKLPVSKEPYWKAIDQGCHLGYYKGNSSSSWIARFRKVNAGYLKTTLGLTDDVTDADGIKIFTYSQAQEMARKWFQDCSKAEAGIEITDKNYTVSHAAADYMRWYTANRKASKEAQRIIDTYILPHFGSTMISALATPKIRDWVNDLAVAPARARTARDGTPNYLKSTNDAESQRKRKASANRILTVFKALLNHAYKEGRVASDDSWRRVKPFSKVDSPRIRYLTKDETTRFINACEGDMRHLALAALLTGGRYTELCSMCCSYYDPDSQTVLFRETKNSKPRHIPLTAEGQALFSQLTIGKSGNEYIFIKEDNTVWGKSHQTRRFRDACKAAGISENVSFHTLRHTYASNLAMQGVPMAVIANVLGHSDTRICERHYAHLSPSYVADTIRSNLPEVGFVADTKVERLSRQR